MDKFAALFERGGLSLDRLRNFCRIEEAGGLSKAAAGDPGRMSLYSRQIKELEGFFGVALTQRNGKGLAVTAEGRRLAQLVRESLLGLEDFQRNCQAAPPRLTVGAGNSLLEWALLPRLGKLRDGLPDLRLDVVSLRTPEIVTRLRELRLDFGLIRQDAAEAAGTGLACFRLFALSYSLFAPRRLLPDSHGATARQMRELLAILPLAIPAGGQFRQQLETSAARAACPLKLKLTCSSFTQAARAVKSGSCGAILPSIAEVDFRGLDVVSIPVGFLRKYVRTVCLAWHPRLMQINAGAAGAAEVLRDVLLPERF